MRRALFAASVVAVVVAISACSSIGPVAEAAPPAPVDPGPQPTETAYATSGWQLQTDILSPLEDRIHVDLETAEVDASGLALYRDLTTGEVAHHPIVNAQYAMTAIREYDRTGDEKWLSRAVRNAEELIATRVEREGAWWYQYDWDWTYLERTLVAPWWSGMAQGEALFVFSRLAMMQPDNPAWREAADRTWDSFPQRGWRNTEPWSTVVLDGNLWFEEYAGSVPPLRVMNGHVFAIFGLYEYWLLTGNATVAQYIDGGATTILDVMPLIRAEGDVTYYCAQPDYCRVPAWQNATYHPIHIQQLQALGRITGDDRFDEWATLLEGDWQPEE